ncbi:MATE family efflux transporter [Jannaschia rubra]|uniref:Multidrug-efflux transporter n=1 Tax=Jannaschia rubra TaxID=282197 RepID=A0A0M6XMP9_9RHOB|nr:MATE family efflux transporter [Jannaschia rubra]CTQ32426.1 Na(+)/drug antiporter [Jannaschia rubra]SFG44604.1 multidrug resistance protein, MATE family [Jannaschia rubra]
MDGLSYHLKRTLVLGLPLVGSQLAQIMVGLTDTIMLGRYSVDALAAGTLGNSMFFLFFIVGAGFAFAVMPLVAQAVARLDDTRTRRVTRMGLWLSGALALGMLPLFFFSGPLLSAAGQGPQVAADTQAYLRIAGFGMIPALLTATFRSHLSAMEHTRIVLLATLAAVVLNAGLNWLLIFGNWGAPELGVRGAAIASVAVHSLTAVVLAIYATRAPGMGRFELLRNIHRPDWPAMAEIFCLGWPISLTHLAESSLFAATALMMGWLGTAALAAHGIAITIAAATFMVHVGLSAAATVRVGQAWGRGDATGLKRAAIAAMILSAAAVVVNTAVYLLAGEWLVRRFLDTSDPEAGAILALGVVLLRVAALFQLVDAAQVMALGLLRGVQDTRRPMIYAIIAYWALGLPVSYGLGFGLDWGPVGLWMGLVIGLAAAGVALTGRFVRIVDRADMEPVTSRS